MASNAAPTQLATNVWYQGFVHADTNDKSKAPGMAHIKAAHEMMAKKNIKKTRELHPLFARGFDTVLQMTLSTDGLRVDLEGKDGKSMIVMNQPMHKIAFVGPVSKTVGIIMKRPGLGKFKCHLFLFDSEAKAMEVCKILARITNEVFRKLKKIAQTLKKKHLGPPPLPPRKTAIPDEEQPWYHGKMSRPDAEALLVDAGGLNGLFLVRMSESTPGDYALSFCYQGKVFHNKITKKPSGEFVNSNGTVFSSLSVMVVAYQSPHEDIKCVITEFIPNKPFKSEDGVVTYENVALKSTSNSKCWDTSDIQEAIRDLEKGGGVGEVPIDAIEFDPIYDDVHFGYGNEFVASALGTRSHLQEPLPELDLDGDMFSIGDLTGETDI